MRPHSLPLPQSFCNLSFMNPYLQSKNQARTMTSMTETTIQRICSLFGHRKFYRQRPRRWRHCPAVSAALQNLQRPLEGLSSVAALVPPPPALSQSAPAAPTSLQPAFDLAGAELYALIDKADQLVAQQLTGLTPLSFAIVLGAGLLTSLSPCTLSVLPLTIGYIGGYGEGAGEGGSGPSLLARSLAFSGGLATTLALLGVASAFLGGAYGQIGDGLPVAVALLAILMGLNLLEVLPLSLPSLDVDVRSLKVPPTLQAYLAGLTFALAASPCSTPILATLLAWVGTTKDPLAGGALLLAYTFGYVGPLLAAALFSGALTKLLAARQWSAWVTPASGVLLVAGGTYALLSRVAPA